MIVTRRQLLATLVILCGPVLLSANSYADGEFIDIAPKSEAEIQLVLDTLDKTINDSVEDLPPIVMMLHGDEAHRFLRRNYDDNKSLIDQTAKLAAYNVVKVQICATWLRSNNYDEAELFPFVSTVPYGAAELERLASAEGYTEYSVNL
jgi:intracellular sulfur oxidation DsrE/DsrF family protein